MRDNFSQLPNAAELQGILDAEAKREIPKGKEDIHYANFEPIIKLAEHLGVDVATIKCAYTPDEVREEGMAAKGDVFVEAIKNKLLDGELDIETVELCNKAYDYLAEEDTLEKADLIFVFGAKTPLRIQKAIELYKAGYANKILVSGRGPFYTENAVTEAETYAQLAIEKGVLKENIIIEDKSITVPDNVRASLNLLDEKNLSFRSIILVNSPYTQRRGWAHFMKYVPEGIQLMRSNSSTADQYKRENWYKDAKGIEVVLSEYIKLKVAVSLNTA